MKDPLQTEQTPYEILGVHKGATRAEIEKAFLAAMRRKVPASTAKNARDALLLHPVKRAWYDLLEYNEDALKRLPLQIINNPGQLVPSHRAAAAQAWEAALKREFPNLNITHCLAVLWYWWALHEEQRFAALLEAAGNMGLPDGELHKENLLQAVRRAEGLSCDPKRGADCGNPDCPWHEDCFSSAPPLQEIWEKVIAYWAMLASTPSFWNNCCGLQEADGRALRKQLVDSLRDTFHELALRYDKLFADSEFSARNTWPEQYRKLELALTTEMSGADALKEAKIQTKFGLVSCGTLMLTYMGLLDTARSQVEAALKNQPGNQRLARLQEMLSPYSAIAILVSQRKPEAALTAIESLPANEKQFEEVQILRLRALNLLAKQKASVGQIDEALSVWESALQSRCPADLQAEIQAEIVSACQARVLAIQNSQRDQAIDLLERATSLAPDEKLRLNLAELLKRRGIDTCNKAQEVAKENQGITREVLADLERSVQDLERAVKLGSSDAAAQAEIARNVLKHAKGAFLDMPEEVASLFRQGMAAAEAENWDKAIECLTGVEKHLGGKAPDNLKKNLATLFNSRGVQKANRAGEMLKKAQEDNFRKAVSR